MAAILGALALAFIIVKLYYLFSFMVLGIGSLGGKSMRRMGKGVDPVFGYPRCHPGIARLSTSALAFSSTLLC